MSRAVSAISPHVIVHVTYGSEFMRQVLTTQLPHYLKVTGEPCRVTWLGLFQHVSLCVSGVVTGGLVSLINPVTASGVYVVPKTHGP